MFTLTSMSLMNMLNNCSSSLTSSGCYGVSSLMSSGESTEKEQIAGTGDITSRGRAAWKPLQKIW